MTISVLPVKTDLKAQVLAVISEHRGWENAIKSQIIADEFGYRDDRVIQIVVENLIAAGHVIAASCKQDIRTGQQMGYYVPVNQVQEQDYKHQLRGRAIGNYIRYRNFKRACAARELKRQHIVQGQLQFEMDFKG